MRKRPSEEQPAGFGQHIEDKPEEDPQGGFPTTHCEPEPQEQEAGE
jgi:hypothetical protein